MCSLVGAFVRACVRSSVRAFILSFVRLFVRWFVRSFVCPSVRPSFRLLDGWLVDGAHVCAFVLSFAFSFLCVRLFIRSFFCRVHCTSLLSSLSSFRSIHRHIILASRSPLKSEKLFHCISRANSDDNNTYFLTYFSDKHFWTQGFVMIGRDKLDCVPLFLGELADDIFVCGKTINLLKLCCPEVCLF